MSSERLEELGVPRRAFLKRAGAAALTAPLIVSFGLDAVAEGATGQPTQCLANQTFANQTEEFSAVFNILRALANVVFENASGQIKPPLSFNAVEALGNLAVDALLLAAAGEGLQAFREWTQFVHEVNASGNHLPQSVKEALIRDAQLAQEGLDCN